LKNILSFPKRGTITLSGNRFPYTVFFQAFSQKTGIQLGIIIEYRRRMRCWCPATLFRGRKKQNRLFEHTKHIRIRSGLFVRTRPADQNGSERLLKGLNVSVKGVSEKMPTGMDLVSRHFQDTQRSTFNEGGIRRKASKKGVVCKALDFLEHRKTPYFANRWVLCPADPGAFPSLQRLYAPVQRLVQLRSFRLRVSPL